MFGKRSCVSEFEPPSADGAESRPTSGYLESRILGGELATSGAAVAGSRSGVRCVSHHVGLFLGGGYSTERAAILETYLSYQPVRNARASVLSRRLNIRKAGVACASMSSFSALRAWAAKMYRCLPSPSGGAAPT